MKYIGNTLVNNDKTLPTEILFDPKKTPDDFILWHENNKEFVDKLVLTSGAIIFKGILIASVNDFERIMNKLNTNSLEYIDGTTPRKKMTSSVYTSTEYDSRQSILLHNELSYSSQWPSRIYFCCITPAAIGGETTIGDSREILSLSNRMLVDKLEEKGINYIRNLTNGAGIGQSWQKAFETEDRYKVEEYCELNSVDYEWKKNGGLRIVQKREAIMVHPITGEKVWFNQIDQFHPIHLSKDILETLLMIYKDEMDLPMYVTFGDGSRIDEDFVTEIISISKAAALPIKWNRGDLVLLDNVLVSHGRLPYKGKREILVSMF